jgi:hypothetical protein
LQKRRENKHYLICLGPSSMVLRNIVCGSSVCRCLLMILEMSP